MDQKSTPESQHGSHAVRHEPHEQRTDTPRAKYEPPRLLRKHSVQRVTLVSGQECVFDPPGSC